MLLIARGAIAYLLIVTAIMCRPISALGPTAGYHISVGTDDGKRWTCDSNYWRTFDLGSDSTVLTDETQTTRFLWTKSIQLGTLSNNSVSEDGHPDNFSLTMDSVYRYVEINKASIRLVTFTDSRRCFEGEGVPSNRNVCAPRYYCLMYSMLRGYSRGSIVYTSNLKYTACLGRFNITREQEDSSTWACRFEVKPWILTFDCAEGSWDLNTANWERYKTDRQLRIALQGGVDENGLYWDGRNGAPLAESFGRQFWNVNLRCTLANPCQHALDCSSVGSFLANPGSSTPYPSRWVYFATAAFVNINQQLRNQYDELKDAIESLALDTFSIDEFFPTKSQDFDLSNSLTGLSGIFSILGGFVPVAGPFISAAGTIASGVGTFLENSVAAAASDDPLAAQRIFSQKVLVFYRASLQGMDNLVSKLFLGEPIPGSGPGSFTLLDMMEGGGWVNPSTLTNVSSLNEKIRREILARSIDSLWKSRTEEQTIKMWVLFTDLSNEPNSIECAQSTSCHSQLIR